MNITDTEALCKIIASSSGVRNLDHSWVPLGICKMQIKASGQGTGRCNDSDNLILIIFSAEKLTSSRK